MIEKDKDKEDLLKRINYLEKELLKYEKLCKKLGITKEYISNMNDNMNVNVYEFLN